MSRLLKGRLKGLNPVPLRSSTCFYPVSPDAVFCVGFHPFAPQVVIAAGAGALGFRYGALVGSLVAQMLKGTSDLDISALDPGRFFRLPSNHDNESGRLN